MHISPPHNFWNTIRLWPMPSLARQHYLGPGYTRDWLPAYIFVLRARAMVLRGERTLSDTSGARQYCPWARQTAADNYVYRLSRALKNRLQRAHQGTDSNAKLRHFPGMPAAEKHKLIYDTETESEVSYEVQGRPAVNMDGDVSQVLKKKHMKSHYWKYWKWKNPLTPTRT
jgi:hypothetical protein